MCISARYRYSVSVVFPTFLRSFENKLEPSCAVASLAGIPVVVYIIAEHALRC